jgi:hypothetical protein
MVHNSLNDSAVTEIEIKKNSNTKRNTLNLLGMIKFPFLLQ